MSQSDVKVKKPRAKGAREPSKKAKKIREPVESVKKAQAKDVDEPTSEVGETPNKRRQVKQISQLEHAKRKSMWTGSKQMQTLEMFLLDPSSTRFVLTTIKFTPTFYKIIDEIMVNAIDHW